MIHPIASPKIQILVVENDAEASSAMGEVLALDGYDIQQAASGSEALAVLRSGYKADLIILDLSLPAKDGFKFRMEQARDGALSEIPVLILTADRNFSSRQAELQASDFIRKPIEADVLLRMVRSIIANGR